jgi:hypothetical protein
VEDLPYASAYFGRAAWVELFKDCELVGECLSFDSGELCHGVSIAYIDPNPSTGKDSRFPNKSE